MPDRSMAVFAHEAATPGYDAPSCSFDGRATSQLFRPECIPMWALTSAVEGDSEITWEREHGDECLFVLEGELSSDEDSCPTGGAVVVEANAQVTLRTSRPTRLVHFGRPAEVRPDESPLGPPKPDGHSTHWVSPRGMARLDHDNHATIFFADSTCPTCRLTLFLQHCEQPRVSGSHTHSEDEIIHVISGMIQVGPHAITPGSSVAIPALTRYGYRAPGPFEFLDYRGDAAFFVKNPGDTPLLETCASVGAVFVDAPS